jgi:hypothetical protein
VKTLERPGLSVSSVGLILSLSAAAGIGYPQTLVYTWVWAGLFALLYTAVVLRSIGKISALAVPAAVAILFSMPTLLPMAQQFLASIRVSGFNESVFLENSVHPASLLSLFSPSLQLPNGFLPHRGTLVFFQGAWLVPVMVLAAGRFSTERRRLFFVLSGLAALFVVFALGQHGFVYPFTRFIPIWGSFRWPYKFLIFGNAALIAAGGLALEAWAQSPARLRIALSVVAAIVTAVLVFVFPGSEKLVLAGIFGTLAFLPFVPAKWATNLFALFVVITCVGVMAQSQNAGFKTYTEKIDPAFRMEGMSLDYRYLPISESDEPALMQPLGLFQSATINGAFSATGCTTAMIPWWYLRWLPSRVTGMIEPAAQEKLLGSQLLRAFNVRYVIAHLNDVAARSLAEKRGYTLLSENGPAVVYQDTKPVLPRVYFASHVFPYEAATLSAGLIENAAPPASVFVEGVADASSQPESRVVSVEEKDNRWRAQVDSPSGGFLVLSTTFSPDWHVKIDGRETMPLRTNGVVVGVPIPPGGRDVELTYRSAGLELGFWLVLIGCLILWLWGRRKNRNA